MKEQQTIEFVTLEEYEDMLKRHDWYYNYTEDRRVWAAGNKNYELLIFHSKQSDEHNQLFYKYKNQYFK